MTAGCSATGRSSSSPSVGMSSCSLSTACSCGSFPRCSSGATSWHSSRSWPFRWRDSLRHRWHSRGTGIDDRASRMTTLKSMRSRKQVIGAVLILLTLPAAYAVIEAVTFYVANRNNGSFVSSGETREYLLYVPRSYDRTRPTPLVISMHGAAGWPAQQMDMDEWSRLAERERFIVV